MGPAVGGVRVSGDRPPPLTGLRVPATLRGFSPGPTSVFPRPCSLPSLPRAPAMWPGGLCGPNPRSGSGGTVSLWEVRPASTLAPRGVLGTRSSEQEVALGFWTAVKARGDTGAFMGQLPESSASLALLSLPGKADDLRFLQLTPVSILSVSSEPSSRGHRAPA